MIQIFNMLNYRSPLLNEFPNTRYCGYGWEAGEKIRKRPPRTSTPARTPNPPTTQSANPTSAPATLQSDPQVNPPFPPSPNFFGTAHPPVSLPWGPFTETEITVQYDALPRNSSTQNDSSDLNNLSYAYTNWVRWFLSKKIKPWFILFNGGHG